MEDIRQTKEWAEYLRSTGWIVERVGKISVFIRRIPLTPFSMMKIQRFCGKIDFDGLKKVKRKHKVVYVVAEPMEEVIEGWKVNMKPFLPTKTVVIGLENSKNRLWDDLSMNAKRILKKRSQVDLVELKREKAGKFYKAWQRSSKAWLMGEEKFTKLLDVFRRKASLWVSESEGEILSGILLLRSKDTANYFQTFTSNKGRQVGAHYQLVWEVMLNSKRDGYTYFDFEGVVDKRWPLKRWLGFSEFKRKFGGEIVSYPGSFVKWF